MDRFAVLTGRRYHLFRYDGHPQAERVVVVMGSASETLRATVAHLNAEGAAVGLLQVLLYRPWSPKDFLAALPASARRVAVLDRTKEPGATAEPLCLDVAQTLAEAFARRTRQNLPLVVGGRYGLSSKEFNPAMAKAVFDHLQKGDPIGLYRRYHGRCLRNQPAGRKRVRYRALRCPSRAVLRPRCRWDGRGQEKQCEDSAEDAGRYAQGYFVYDSHKSGAETISHLRFGNAPLAAPYLLQSADFIGVHKFDFLQKRDVLALQARRHRPDQRALRTAAVWDHLSSNRAAAGRRERPAPVRYRRERPRPAPRSRTAGEHDLQTCFFAISGVLPREEGIRRIRKSIEKSYGGKGKAVLEKNFAAVDTAVEHLHEVAVPKAVTSTEELRVFVPDDAPDQVRRIAALQFAGRGDDIPVSAIPADGVTSGAQPNTRSAMSPSRYRSGSRISASNAANAVLSVRIV